MYRIGSIQNGYFEAKPGHKWSWETPPEPIPESEIIETVEADVVIAGAGISGLACGCRAAQLGGKVIVIEKNTTFAYRGAHMGAINSKVMEAKGIKIDKYQFVRDWIRACGNRCDEKLVWRYVNNSEKVMNWVIDMGESYGVGCEIFGGYYKGPDYTEYPGTHILLGGPNCTLGDPNRKHKPAGAQAGCEIFITEIKKHGGEIRYKTPAVQLEKDETGRVVAIIGKSEDGYRRFVGRKGVVLATGDVGGDPEMVAAYAPIGLKPKRNAYNPPKMNTGDGHKMGYWAGGTFEDGPWPTTIHLTAYALYTFFFLFVNIEGNRFMNEDNWIQAKSLNVLRQPGGEFAYTVFDSDWIEEVERLSPIGGGQFWEPLVTFYGVPWKGESNGIPKAIEHYLTKGLAFKADTIEELAEKMGVPVENLTKTVDRYNYLADKGEDMDFGKRPELMLPIRKGPFYALKWGPAFLNTDGGFNVDMDLNILDADRKPIPGLYAAGNTIGGLYGVDYPVILNGNSHGKCMTFGYIAATKMMTGNTDDLI